MNIINLKLILQYFLKKNGRLLLGTYDGDVSDQYRGSGGSFYKDDRNFPMYMFIGRQINFKKKNITFGDVLVYPINSKWSYSKECFREVVLEEPEIEFNPLDFEWDYYTQPIINI